MIGTKVRWMSGEFCELRHWWFPSLLLGEQIVNPPQGVGIYFPVILIFLRGNEEVNTTVIHRCLPERRFYISVISMRFGD